LAAAEATGAAWCITVDTDERIDPRGVDIRDAITRTDASVLLMSIEQGTYAKDRLFRLPAAGRWIGPTHEYFPSHRVVRATLPTAVFRELPKDDAGWRHKLERDRRILDAETRRHPDEPRWFYYLGDVLMGLGSKDEAVQAWIRCADLRGWDEESAWACYRAAQCRCEEGRHDEAVELAAKGLARHAGIAELSWLAALSSYRAGRYAQAIHWARLSVAAGHYQGFGRTLSRIGFRYLPALYEGPFDVLRYAQAALGDRDGALEAEAHHQAAMTLRTLRHAVPADDRTRTGG
jgi:tetratricopeptide (TPR) repeat protein